MPLNTQRFPSKKYASRSSTMFGWWHSARMSISTTKSSSSSSSLHSQILAAAILPVWIFWAFRWWKDTWATVKWERKTYLPNLAEGAVANLRYLLPNGFGILMVLYVVIQFFSLCLRAALSTPKHLWFDFVEESRHVASLSECWVCGGKGEVQGRGKSINGERTKWKHERRRRRHLFSHCTGVSMLQSK